MVAQYSPSPQPLGDERALLTGLALICWRDAEADRDGPRGRGRPRREVPTGNACTVAADTIYRCLQSGLAWAPSPEAQAAVAALVAQEGWADRQLPDLASRTLRFVATKGLYLEAKRAEGRVRAFVSRDDGAVALSMPQYAGLREREESGQVVWQRGLWEEYTWGKYRQWRADRRAQADTLLAELDVHDAVAQLEAVLPESMGPGDALRRLGLDPAAFSIDDVRRAIQRAQGGGTAAAADGC